MTRTAGVLLSIGVVLFIGVLVSQGLPAVVATLARAGWGLGAVAAFHLLPLALDAAAICVLFGAGFGGRSLRDALLARWAGESANSLMPAGQLGGPVLMTVHLTQRGVALSEAAAAITVSTTLQTFAQIVFALCGVILLGTHGGGLPEYDLRTAALIASAFLAVQIAGFYFMQRRGFFGKVLWAVRRFAGKRDWSRWQNQAQAIDGAVQSTYARSAPVMASFMLSLVGWIVGTGEVYLIALLLGTPVSWSNAFLLESLGQAVRGAGFAIPGALGVQEAGYLLLGPLAGLPTDAALALSLAKRARELLLGLPGLVYMRFAARSSAAKVSEVRH
jgi:putative membrane protein